MPHKKVIFKLTAEKQKVLSDYLDYKKTSCNSKSKMNNYNYFISLFLEGSNKPLKDYGEKEIIDFLNNNNSKYSVGTMNEVKWMVKSFICWHFDDYPKRFRNLNHILKLQKKEKTYSPEQMLSIEKIEKLIQEEPQLRWKVFFFLLFYGGFRPGEVCKLKWKAITFTDDKCSFITITASKNKEQFEKFIPENATFYLTKWKERNNNSEYLFPTIRTNKHGVSVGDVPMTSGGVYQHLLPLAQKVFGKHINPYILRHSVATILYSNDNVKDDISAAQMGHSLAMKKTYNNQNRDEIRKRARKNWAFLKGEDVPPQKREEYEERLNRQQSQIVELIKNQKHWQIALSGAIDNMNGVQFDKFRKELLKNNNVNVEIEKE